VFVNVGEDDMTELNEIDRVVVVLIEGTEELARLIRAELHP